MLYLPTSNDIKFKAKAWIDVVGARTAKALGSAINDAVQGNPGCGRRYRNTGTCYFRRISWPCSASR